MYKIIPIVCWENINGEPCLNNAEYQIVNEVGKIYVCPEHVKFYNSDKSVNEITNLSELKEKDLNKIKTWLK